MNKEIEEISDIISNNIEFDDIGGGSISIDEDKTAEALYNAGYRNCKALLEENEKLVHDHNIMIDALQEAQKLAREMISEENINKISAEIEEIKKKALKDFVEELIYTLTINNEGNTETLDYDYTIKTIKELVK